MPAYTSANDQERSSLLPKAKTQAFLEQNVATETFWMNIPLCLLSIVTGIVGYTVYHASELWPGWVTGSILQTGASITKNGRFEIEDYQRICAILCFGVAGGLGKRWGESSREALLSRGILSSACILAAAICLLTSVPTADDGWTSIQGFICLSLCAASTGLQMLDGQALDTYFMTTVVQTTVWLGFFTLPLNKLFSLSYTPERDLRLLSLAALVLGSVIAQTIFNVFGSNNNAQAGALFAAAILKMIVSAFWVLLPKEKPE